MLSINDIITILGDTVLDGNMAIAGTLLLVGVLAFVMAISKKVLTTLVLAVPLIMVFAVMGWLPPEIGIIMLVVVALGIGLESRGVFS